MVSAVHGTLLECDIPTRVSFSTRTTSNSPSVSDQDLDETHLLVQPHKIEMVRGEVKKFQEKSQCPDGDRRTLSHAPAPGRHASDFHPGLMRALEERRSGDVAPSSRRTTTASRL